MKLISYILGALLLASGKGQATDCDYDYVCDDTGSPGNLVMAAPTPRACYEACRQSTLDGLQCDFWTYYEELGFKSNGEDNGTVLDVVDRKTKATGIPVCRRLTSCDTKFSLSRWCDPALGKQKCASGPGSCEDCDKCPPLDYLVGTAISHWSCDIDMPYQKTNMPPLSICRTECPSIEWSASFITAQCESGCQVGNLIGNWVLTPDAPTIDAVPNVHPGPTLDAPCLCPELILGPDQLPNSVNGATMEEGARFYCEDPGLVDPADPAADGNLNTMVSDSRCKLYCNNHLTMDIYCQAGSWTDGVSNSDDIYCFGPPKDCTYNPGVNTEVCTCSNGDGSLTEHCAVGQACNNGVCETACDESPTEIAADCFCQGPTAGETCAVTNFCIDFTCAPACAESATPIANGGDCLCQDGSGGGELCGETQICNTFTCT